jgi:4-diphosphocytidyl-2-C-methyl-D-erythritol kinase
VLTATAHAKVNLALVVGPRRADGKHEVVTLVEKLALADTVAVAAGDGLRVEGFAADTLVRSALSALARHASVEPCFAATIEKRIPVAAGLGGGSSDAAAALVLGNSVLGEPLGRAELGKLAATLGADVPLFLVPGPVLATGDGTTVAPARLPRDYHVVLWLPAGAEKGSTAEVYRRFDAAGGEAGFAQRRAALEACLTRLRSATDLAALPPNDLDSSPLAARLLEHGAFRADVTGAGPVVYGLFTDRRRAEAAVEDLRREGRAWLTGPAADG